MLLQVADVDELAHTVECTLGCDPNFKYIFNKHTQKYESRPHQFNCTYFSAVGRAFPQHRDRMYLMARVIQFFTPGIPMIYYVGLLAGENDLQVRSRLAQAVFWSGEERVKGSVELKSLHLTTQKDLSHHFECFINVHVTFF